MEITIKILNKIWATKTEALLLLLAIFLKGIDSKKQERCKAAPTIVCIETGRESIGNLLELMKAK